MTARDIRFGLILAMCASYVGPGLVCTENPNSDHSGDEVRPGWHVNE